MRGKGIRQTQHGRELGAKQARAQDPQRNIEPRAGNRLDDLTGLKRAEKGLQFQDVLREGIGAERIASQCPQVR